MIQYINYIKANNLKPLAIMLTHAHFDHVGAMEALKKEYGIEVIAGEDEKPVLENPSINLTTMIGTAKSYSADRYVKDGEEVELGKMKFKVISLRDIPAGKCLLYMRRYNDFRRYAFYGKLRKNRFSDRRLETDD